MNKKKIYTRTCIYFRIFKQYKMQTKRSQHGGHTEGRTVKADPFIDRKNQYHDSVSKLNTIG